MPVAFCIVMHLSIFSMPPHLVLKDHHNPGVWINSFCEGGQSLFIKDSDIVFQYVSMWYPCVCGVNPMTSLPIE